MSLARWLVVWLVTLLAGCASLPDATGRAPEPALPPDHGSPLGRLAHLSVPAGPLSGFKLMASGPVALQTRLVLIEQARSTVDLQVYQFKSDRSGWAVLRALRDAAARGVRVRLLVDDFYTVGDDLMWLGMAAHPGVEVRLFNPIGIGRDSLWLRLLTSLLGDERLHRRMHNKLMVVDGVVAIAGGRNVGDEYFAGGGDHNFYDFDVLTAGAVVPQLSSSFDPYWNSRFAHDVREVLAHRGGETSLQEAFARSMVQACGSTMCPPPPVPPSEMPAWLAMAQELARGRLEVHLAHASAAADAPEKIATVPAEDLTGLAASGAEVQLRVAMAVRHAREEMVIVSPYLIPGANGITALNDFRQRGVRVVLMTNSLAATDEPLVHVGYRRYRTDIVRAGVELYEWSPVRSGRLFRQLLGGRTVIRLHAKCALIDRRFVYLGSMNFDPRSRGLNTEFGLLIHSEGLAEEIRTLVDGMRREAAHRVLLASDGRSLRWVPGDAPNAAADEGFEPGTDFWSRLLWDLLSPFVPEELL
jgi:putative cardiolipin synthase